MGGESSVSEKIFNLQISNFVQILYELMNKKFRATQRVIDQCNFHFQKEFSVLERKLKGQTQPIPLTEVIFFYSQSFAALIFLNIFLRNFELLRNV